MTPASPSSPEHPVVDLQERCLRRGGDATPARTLVDVFEATAARHPDAVAIDDGQVPLTYAAMLDAAAEVATRLGVAGIGRGDRVGVRIPSGTNDLYVAILGILLAGAAYVPVDADDPPGRAELVFVEADVAAVLGADGALAPHRVAAPPSPEPTGFEGARGTR